jgi:hypothetical protein
MGQIVMIEPEIQSEDPRRDVRTRGGGTIGGVSDSGSEPQCLLQRVVVGMSWK